eukprot:g908.t1
MSAIGWEASAVQCAAYIIDACPFVGMDRLFSTCLWLIPNRFAGQELAAEACQAVVGVMRVCYESIANTDKRSSRVSWTLAMKLIRQVEVLYEMRATHLEVLGTCNKYSPIAALELIKLFVRLFYLSSSQNRLTTTLTSPNFQLCSKDSYHVARAFKILSESKQSIQQQQQQQSTRNPTNEFGDEVEAPGLSPRTNEARDTVMASYADTGRQGERIGALPWWNDHNEEAVEACIDDEEGASFTDNSQFYCRLGQTMLLIGELLYLIRPVLCVFALRKFGTQSWKPWLLSLGIDICSRLLLSKGESIMKNAGIKKCKDPSIQDQLLNYLTMVRNFQWTPVEQKEMKRRRTVFLIYLLRSPLFELLTKPGLDSAQNLASTIPVLGKVIGKAIELLHGAQRYYVYTNGSW